MTVTVEGVELIDTPTGNYETIKITIISDFTETIMEQHQEKDQNQQNSAAAQQNNLNNNKLNQDQRNKLPLVIPNFVKAFIKFGANGL